MQEKRTRRQVVLTTLVLLAACRGAGQGPTTVNVELGEYSIKVDRDRVPAGRVRFVAKNVGQMEHELVVVRTDLPAHQLPYNEAEQVAEEETAGQLLGEIEPEDLPPGKSAEMTLELTRGHYVLLCNIPTHYKLGMYLDFNVD